MFRLNYQDGTLIVFGVPLAVIGLFGLVGMFSNIRLLWLFIGGTIFIIGWGIYSFFFYTPPMHRSK